MATGQSYQMFPRVTYFSLKNDDPKIKFTLIDHQREQGEREKAEQD